MLISTVPSPKAYCQTLQTVRKTSRTSPTGCHGDPTKSSPNCHCATSKATKKDWLFTAGVICLPGQMLSFQNASASRSSWKQVLFPESSLWTSTCPNLPERASGLTPSQAILAGVCSTLSWRRNRTTVASEARPRFSLRSLDVAEFFLALFVLWLGEALTFWIWAHGDGKRTLFFLFFFLPVYILQGWPDS